MSGRILIRMLMISCLCLGLVAGAGAEEKQQYTVKPGDTLWGLAKQFYGDEQLWPKLWEINKFNTTNPHRISVGDVLDIFPLDRLMRAQAPPAPPPVEGLYDRGQPMETYFPKYFTFLADPKGIGGSGVLRIKVKKRDPLTGGVVESYDEVREVGEIVASTERGDGFGQIKLDDGKRMLSFYDNVMVRFSADVAKILDSHTHEDPDPFFRSFPIYGMGLNIREPGRARVEYKENIGRLHQYKGNLTVVARVESLVPMPIESSDDTAHQVRRHGRFWAGDQMDPQNSETEPVSYVARIMYSELPIDIGDKVFLFKSLYPGPDRVFGQQKLHEAGEYTAPNMP